MRWFCLILPVLAILSPDAPVEAGVHARIHDRSLAGDQDRGSPPRSSPDPAATLAYIHGAWDTLTRSVTDCHSLADVKVTARPVLFLPREMPVPPAVRALEGRCNVRLLSLPRPVERIGDLSPRELDTQGLLYLPHPYVVPGGRFNEMYGWDSYFIILGLMADHREQLARGMVDNFLFEIEHYGGVLNANRTYYLTRSQPPFLTSMIRALRDDPASFTGPDDARRWLERAYRLAGRDYSTWTRPEHRAGATHLARYFDFGTGPVPEMADDPSYYIEVIRWLVDHPRSGGSGFLLRSAQFPAPAEARRLRTTSCDLDLGPVCGKAWFGGYRLSHDFYLGDRAMRESGFDPSFRFGPFSGRTHHFAPVCLNSLLYRYELDMQQLALELGRRGEAEMWRRRAEDRDRAIHRYLWHAGEGVFADYDFVRGRPSTYAYLTSLYPLWAAVATPAEARQVESTLARFERPGGLSMSTTPSGLQWDEPFGWAPTNWIAVSGLDAAGFGAEAGRIARSWNGTVDAGFARDGTIREKYNVVSGDAGVKVSAGYATNQIGFGWTNGVYLKMREIESKEGGRAGGAP